MLFVSLTPPKQFSDVPKGTRVLQRTIEIKPEHSNKFVVAYVDSRSDIEYFEAPNIKDGAWANGLDDKELVCECIGLHDSHKAALNSIKANTHLFSTCNKTKVYKTVFHKSNDSLELVFDREYISVEQDVNS